MSIVEPWSRVAELMEADSLGMAPQVKDIVATHKDDFVNTQAALRRLPGYKSVIAKEYLPRLRRVEYEINSTEFRNLTLPEIWERYRAGEEDISRYEYWRLIESCDTEESRIAMEREALKAYPNFALIANREAVRLHNADSINLEVLAPSVRLHAPLEINFNQSLMALKARDVDLADSLMRFMPTNSKTSYLKAIVNSLNGDYEAAYPYLASMGGLNEVLILLCMGRNKDADAKITAILEDQSNWKNADVWYVKAICANRLEDLNWAIEALQQAITIDPKLIEIARLDSDVMDVLDIIMPPEEEEVE
jgi:tetratricopeptide (TPR) repeat protein